ncbi:MAG: hypothetical protein WDW38_008155 [Sanguina aurantia]
MEEAVAATNASERWCRISTAAAAAAAAAAAGSNLPALTASQPLRAVLDADVAWLVHMLVQQKSWLQPLMQQRSAAVTDIVRAQAHLVALAEHLASATLTQPASGSVPPAEVVSLSQLHRVTEEQWILSQARLDKKDKQCVLDEAQRLEEQSPTPAQLGVEPLESQDQHMDQQRILLERITYLQLRPPSNLEWTEDSRPGMFMWVTPVALPIVESGPAQKYYSREFEHCGYPWRMMAMIIKPKDVGWQLRVFLEAMRPPPTPMQHTFALKFTLINHMTLSLSITKDTSHCFCAVEPDWGFSMFADLAAATDPSGGFSRDGCLTFQPPSPPQPALLASAQLQGPAAATRAGDRADACAHLQDIRTLLTGALLDCSGGLPLLATVRCLDNLAVTLGAMLECHTFSSLEPEVRQDAFQTALWGFVQSLEVNLLAVKLLEALQPMLVPQRAGNAARHAKRGGKGAGAGQHNDRAVASLSAKQALRERRLLADPYPAELLVAVGAVCALLIPLLAAAGGACRAGDERAASLLHGRVFQLLDVALAYVVDCNRIRKSKQQQQQHQQQLGPAATGDITSMTLQHTSIQMCLAARHAFWAIGGLSPEQQVASINTLPPHYFAGLCSLAAETLAAISPCPPAAQQALLQVASLRLAGGSMAVLQFAVGKPAGHPAPEAAGALTRLLNSPPLLLSVCTAVSVLLRSSPHSPPAAAVPTLTDSPGAGPGHQPATQSLGAEEVLADVSSWYAHSRALQAEAHARRGRAADATVPATGSAAAPDPERAWSALVRGLCWLAGRCAQQTDRPAEHRSTARLCAEVLLGLSRLDGSQRVGTHAAWEGRLANCLPCAAHLAAVLAGALTPGPGGATFLGESLGRVAAQVMSHALPASGGTSRIPASAPNVPIARDVARRLVMCSLDLCAVREQTPGGHGGRGGPSRRAASVWRHGSMAFVVESAFRNSPPRLSTFYSAEAHSHDVQTSKVVSASIRGFIETATQGLVALIAQSKHQQHQQQQQHNPHYNQRQQQQHDQRWQHDQQRLQQHVAVFTAAVPSIISLHMTHFKLIHMRIQAGARRENATPPPSDAAAKGPTSLGISQEELALLIESLWQVVTGCHAATTGIWFGRCLLQAPVLDAAAGSRAKACSNITGHGGGSGGGDIVRTEHLNTPSGGGGGSSGGGGSTRLHNGGLAKSSSSSSGSSSDNGMPIGGGCSVGLRDASAGTCPGVSSDGGEGTSISISSSGMSSRMSAAEERSLAHAWLRLQLVVTRTWRILKSYAKLEPDAATAVAVEPRACTAAPPFLGGVLSMHLALAARPQPSGDPTVSCAPVQQLAAAHQTGTASGTSAATPTPTPTPTADAHSTAPPSSGTGYVFDPAAQGVLMRRVFEACGDGYEGRGPGVQARWELWAFTHVRGPIFPGCSLTHCCNIDGRSEAELPTLLCSGCRRARYCGAECQRAAWVGRHRAVCQDVGVRAAASADMARRLQRSQTG